MTSQRVGLGWGMVIALVSSAAFGVSGPLAKALIETGWTSGAAVLVRVSGAAAVLAVPTLLVARRVGARSLRRQFGFLFGYGLVAVAGAQIGFFSAVRTLPVGVALLIEYVAPVIVVGWLWLRRGQRPGRRTVAGAVAAMLGLVGVLDTATPGGLDPAGVTWALFAALCLTGYFLLSARVHDDLPPVLVIGSGMIVATAVTLLAGAVGLLPMAFVAETTTLAGWQVPFWVPAVGLVLICSVLSYLTGIVAVRALGARLASFVALTEVLFAVVVAWLALGELPTPRQLAGGVFIVVGVVLVRLGEPTLDSAGTDGPATPEPRRG